MTIKTSTGLRNGVLATGSLKSLLDGLVLKLYAGPVPTSADSDIPGATLLCTITNDATATGLTFGSPAVSGVLYKTSGEIWRGVNAAAGNAAFYRLCAAADPGGESTTEIRIQGTVSAGGGGDLNLSSVALVNGASQSIDFFSLELPTG